MELAEGDHRAFRPDGWIEAGLEKLERVIPIAEREELKPIQLACQWNLAHPAVECVVPTLIQETGPAALPIEEKRAQLAALPEQRLSEADVAEIRGDRRQHRLHGAEGREPRARGRGAARPLGARRRPGRGRRPLGDRPRPRSLRRHSAIEAGVLILPITAPMIAISPFSGRSGGDQRRLPRAARQRRLVRGLGRRLDLGRGRALRDRHRPHLGFRPRRPPARPGPRRSVRSGPDQAQHHRHHRRFHL